MPLEDSLGALSQESLSCVASCAPTVLVSPASEMTSDFKDTSSNDTQSKVVVQVLPSVPLSNVSAFMMDYGSLISPKSYGHKPSMFQCTSQISNSSASLSPSGDSELSDSLLSEKDDIHSSEDSSGSDSFSEAENQRRIPDEHRIVTKRMSKNDFELWLKKKKQKISSYAREIMTLWLLHHKQHPFPSREEKEEIADLTNLSEGLISRWISLNRQKILAPLFPKKTTTTRYYSKLESDVASSQVSENSASSSSLNDKQQTSGTNDLQASFSGSLSSVNKTSEGDSSGLTLSHIDHIASELETASDSVIRILHYILFGTYGSVGNEVSLQQTKEKILQYSGLNFPEDKMLYVKKMNSLMHLPYPLLVCIHKILINTLPNNRSEAVGAVLHFLSNPSGLKKEEKLMERMTQREYIDLKKQALEVQPMVILERLNKNIIEKMVPKKQFKELKSSNCQTIISEKYVKPSFICNGNGIPLKTFSTIAKNVKNARRRIINVLHSLLYGRPGSDSINRQNILEFNGFESSQKAFYMRKTTFLERLRMKELWQLCDVLSLRAKSGNKTKKIKKILFFLQSPGVKLKKEKLKQPVRPGEISAKIIAKESQDTSSSTSYSGSKIKLQDFECIRTNIECATPENLIELNDLLFMKPCDDADIHQKILNFSSFPFNESSSDFHYRKTVMQYMDLKVLQKIAALLDIKDWQNYTYKGTLVSAILNFLVDLKLSAKKRKSDLKNQNAKPFILKLQSSKDTVRSSSSENFDSTYASEEINEIIWIDDCYENTSYSRHCHRKSSLSSKQEQILNDPTPLLEYIQHPSEQELECLISKILTSIPLSSSMGYVVNAVLNYFPNLNLNYRIDFIKMKTLEMLQEIRQSAILSD